MILSHGLLVISNLLIFETDCKVNVIVAYFDHK